MLEAAKKAMAYTSDQERAVLDVDEMRALAVVRLLQIVGEAAKAVTHSTRAQFPEVPWRQIAGTRDRLIHGYDAVDLDVVWAIVTGDLPLLIERIERALANPC
jgi:uncharacterized protein with HEPN domain